MKCLLNDYGMIILQESTLENFNYSFQAIAIRVPLSLIAVITWKCIQRCNCRKAGQYKWTYPWVAQPFTGAPTIPWTAILLLHHSNGKYWLCPFCWFITIYKKTFIIVSRKIEGMVTIFMHLYDNFCTKL